MLFPPFFSHTCCVTGAWCTAGGAASPSFWLAAVLGGNYEPAGKQNCPTMMLCTHAGRIKEHTCYTKPLVVQTACQHSYCEARYTLCAVGVVAVLLHNQRLDERQARADMHFSVGMPAHELQRSAAMSRITPR
jgi:hypothetical protein